MSELAPPITGVVPVRDGRSLFFGEWPGDGPAIVLVHGLTSTHRNWSGIVRSLASPARIVAPDLLGRGNSSCPPDHGIERHASDVLELMDAVGIGRAIVGGHSMGAVVATAIAAFAPERIDGLFLVDGGAHLPRDESAPPPDPDALMGQVLTPVMERMRRTFATPGDYRALWQAMPYWNGEWGPIVEDYLAYDLVPRDGGYVSKCDETAATEDWRDLLTNPETAQRLVHVRCPVALVAAEHGLSPGDPPVVGEANLAHLRSIAPDVEATVVPGTTHHTVTLSQRGAKATADALEAFVAKLAVSA